MTLCKDFLRDWYSYIASGQTFTQIASGNNVNLDLSQLGPSSLSFALIHELTHVQEIMYPSATNIANTIGILNLFSSTSPLTCFRDGLTLLQLTNPALANQVVIHMDFHVFSIWPCRIPTWP